VIRNPWLFRTDTPVGIRSTSDAGVQLPVTQTLSVSLSTTVEGKGRAAGGPYLHCLGTASSLGSCSVLMVRARASDHEAMAKDSPKEPAGDDHPLKPEMRELILSFDAKDRRAQPGKSPNGSSKQRRRRGDNPARAA
jgi:hypothetical protein